jgi:hypothetical protein
MDKKTQLLHWLAITLSLLASSGLMTELYLASMGKSWCHASACAIVTKYIRFGEPLLLSCGAGFFLILAGSIFFARRYEHTPLVFFLPTITIIGSAAFDGALLGFQFITLRQHCLLCITVAITLGLVTLLYSVSRKKWSIVFLALTVWSAGFLANAMLIMPDTTEAHTGMIFYERPAAKELTRPPVATLIFSLECPHCTEIIELLAKQNSKTITWRFAITDDSSQSYDKLGHFYANLSATTNPFQLLLESKKRQTRPDNNLLAKLSGLSRQARLFLANNGIYAVPVLVFKEPNDRITIIPGSPGIVAFLRSLKP